MSDALAEATAVDWENYKGADIAFLEESKRILDREDPSYAN
jgi:hypothetical protein